MKVITLSKAFPACHPRSGEPTGFADAFLGGRKIHTIRENKEGYYKDGDVVSVRQWSGKPYASKQVILEDGIKIGVIHVRLSWLNGDMAIRVGNIPVSPSVVARNDGLSCWDFFAWFNPRSVPNLELNYSIIHFNSFRYE